MSMTGPDLPPPFDPAPPTAPGPAAGLGLVEFVRTGRPAAAYVLLGLSALFLAGTVFLASRAYRTAKAADPAAAAAVDPLNPDAAPPPPVEVADPKKGDYQAGAVLAAAAFLVTAAGGAFLLLGLPRPTAAGQRAEARAVILGVGGGLGFGLMLAGGWFFYRWLDSLTKFLERDERKELLYVAVPLLLVVAGAGVVFAAVQPARAEERDDPLLRRLVYGTNFGLTAFLLLLVLVVANVFVAVKVPAKLDTTADGFYTLADPTKAFLDQLPEPVTLYVIINDSGHRLLNDVRQFAAAAQDASGGKLTAKFVSPAANTAELRRLQDKYNGLGRDETGILVTAGADERRNAFIPLIELFDREPGRGGVSGFAGEGRVMKELRFLADNQTRPKVYFTQSNGEPAVGGGGGEAVGGGSAAQLRGFLDRAYTDVQPLAFPLKDPAVPADAAAVVVMDPQTPLGEGAAAAVRRYVVDRKGKLVVLAGGVPGPDGKPVKTGLEGLLSELGVRLGDKFVYSEPLQQAPDERVTVAAFAKASERNPIVQTVGRQVPALSFVLPREVAVAPGGPTYQATPLMITYPGRDTWLEDEAIRDREQALTDLFANERVRERKGYSAAPRPVAAVVTEGGAARAVVVGNGAAFADRAADRARPGTTPPAFDLLASALDWLRDRPQLPTTVESKKYKDYTFPDPATVDTTRLVWFPIGLGLLVVAGLGAGVWVARRK